MSTTEVPRPRTEAPAADPAAAPRTRRARLAALERPFLLAGLALVALHLLDMAFAGPGTTILGVVGIVAVPLAWAAAQPRMVRPTRIALGVVFGLLAVGFGFVAHVLHVANGGWDWPDVSGLGFFVGGLLLVASAVAAAAAPRRAPRRPALAWRAAHLVGWAAGAVVFFTFAVVPVGGALLVTHAPRWTIHESSVGVPHEEVRIVTADGTEQSAWYVPSRTGAAVLLSHGSGGSRQRVADRVRMLARHGYGVLALDNPGNGESDGRSNGLGENAQPGIDAAMDYLARRPDVRPDRIGGFGVSLGAEVLIEAAAREPRLRALVADGATRPQDGATYGGESGLERVSGWLQVQVAHGISGARPARSLVGLIPRIAPRPVLLVAGGGFPVEIPANRVYRRAGGETVELWERPGAAHTAGLRVDPAQYERRTVGFLDRALAD
jgi:pimeloyl-ACP methyl ester carboxylesterase